MDRPLAHRSGSADPLPLPFLHIREPCVTPIAPSLVREFARLHGTGHTLPAAPATLSDFLQREPLVGGKRLACRGLKAGQGITNRLREVHAPKVPLQFSRDVPEFIRHLTILASRWQTIIAQSRRNHFSFGRAFMPVHSDLFVKPSFYNCFQFSDSLFGIRSICSNSQNLPPCRP